MSVIHFHFMYLLIGCKSACVNLFLPFLLYCFFCINQICFIISYSTLFNLIIHSVIILVATLEQQDYFHNLRHYLPFSSNFSYSFSHEYRLLFFGSCMAWDIAKYLMQKKISEFSYLLLSHCYWVNCVPHPSNSCAETLTLKCPRMSALGHRPFKEVIS